MRRAAAAVLLTFLLSGCSTISGWFSDKDNSTPPAKLEEIKDPVSLKELWSRDIGVGYDDQFVNLVPAVSGKYLLAAERDGRVVELSTETGKELWETKTHAPISAGPGVGDGLVFVGASDAQVLALNIDDGSIVWRAQVSSEVLAVPRIDLGVVIIQTADGTITGLSSSDGHRLWVADHFVPVLSLRGTSSPAVVGNAVIAGFANGKIAAISTSNGFQAWETSVAIPKGRSEIDRLVDVDADPVIVGDSAYRRVVPGKDRAHRPAQWQSRLDARYVVLCRTGGGLLTGLRHRQRQRCLGAVAQQRLFGLEADEAAQPRPDGAGAIRQLCGGWRFRGIPASPVDL